MKTAPPIILQRIVWLALKAFEVFMRVNYVEKLSASLIF